MENNLKHLLSKHGVLVSFTIAKKVDENTIKKLTEKIKSASKNKTDFNNKLKTEIENDTKNAILTGKIPGLIVESQDIDSQEDEYVPDPPLEEKPVNKKQNPKLRNDLDIIQQFLPNPPMDKKKLAILYTIASLFNKEVLINDLSKDEICFIVHIILNFLEVSETDFKKFYQKIQDEYEDENPEDEDDTKI